MPTGKEPAAQARYRERSLIGINGKARGGVKGGSRPGWGHTDSSPASSCLPYCPRFDFEHVCPVDDCGQCPDILGRVGPSFLPSMNGIALPYPLLESCLGLPPSYAQVMPKVPVWGREARTAMGDGLDM